MPMNPSRRQLAGLLAMAIPGSALAQGRGHGGNPHGGPPGHAPGGPPGHARGGPPGHSRGGPPGFAAHESHSVKGWVAANPGYVARPLPPGQMRQIARGRPLPPGLQRRALPPALVATLPPRPGYEYVAIGTSIALVAIGSGIVADVMAGVLAR